MKLISRIRHCVISCNPLLRVLLHVLKSKMKTFWQKKKKKSSVLNIPCIFKIYPCCIGNLVGKAYHSLLPAAKGFGVVWKFLNEPPYIQEVSISLLPSEMFSNKNNLYYVEMIGKYIYHWQKNTSIFFFFFPLPLLSPNHREIKWLAPNLSQSLARERPLTAQASVLHCTHKATASFPGNH